jgi:hypothetical protein
MVAMKTLSRTIAVAAVALIALPVQAGEHLAVVERALTDTEIDLGPKGDSVGDLLTFANPIFDAANKVQLGTDQG